MMGIRGGIVGEGGIMATVRIKGRREGKLEASALDRGCVSS